MPSAETIVGSRRSLPPHPDPDARTLPEPGATRPIVVSLARTLVLVGLASLVILVLFPAAMAAQAATA